MKKKITKEGLIELLGKSQDTDLALKYRAWSKLESKDLLSMILVGMVSVNEEYNQEYPTTESYWSPKYPIALEYYPYFGCDIYSDGKSYFTIYQDFGGMYQKGDAVP